jgi:hypothetical protein
MNIAEWCVWAMEVSEKYNPDTITFLDVLENIEDEIDLAKSEFLKELPQNEISFDWDMPKCKITQSGKIVPMPKGIPVSMASIILRVFFWAEKVEIDLEEIMTIIKEYCSIETNEV